jgi:hypothetical protein
MPDVEIKPQKYRDPRPPEHFEPFHARGSRVRNWKRLQFPKVTVSYGTPLRFAPIASPTREQQQEAADLGLDRIRAPHGELVRRGHRGSRRAERPHAMA